MKAQVEEDVGSAPSNADSRSSSSSSLSYGRKKPAKIQVQQSTSHPLAQQIEYRDDEDEDEDDAFHGNHLISNTPILSNTKKPNSYALSNTPPSIYSTTIHNKKLPQPLNPPTQIRKSTRSRRSPANNSAYFATDDVDDEDY